jgi:asparagine synthase (glutamine-hydrolysing)
MSGIVGVFPRDRAPVEAALMQRMLSQMSARGNGCSAVWRGEGAALAVARNTWESTAEFSGEVLVVRDRELAIAADASLYYRADLQKKLAAMGARLQVTTPSHLILAAYRAWGDQCVRHLEGDYAFILWDERQDRVLCARDFGGSRPLFYAEIGDSLVVASTLHALRAHPHCPGGFNEYHLAETAANLWLSAYETAHSALTAVPAGFVLSRNRRGVSCLSRSWHPPTIDSRNAAPLAEAAAELRECLGRAVQERLAPEHITSVWMSGGRDSTAVFGAGQSVLQQRPGARRLRPVSLSYPLGHPGREDEFITAVAQYWNVPVHWLHLQEIPPVERPVWAAAQRDEPYEPPFETFNRAAARASRSLGARVALDGWGGDQLFASSPVYLADLLRTGRWMALAREWRAFQVHDFRSFFSTAITPTLPPFLHLAATWLRGGRRLQDELQHCDWLSKRLEKTVRERQQCYVRGGRGSSLATQELYLSLTSATWSRVRGWHSALALEEGVEVRSPLYDGRVIELAVARPRDERRSGRDTKILLRAAMRGLLPDDVLAPRRARTGVPGNYFRNALRTTYAQLLNQVIDSSVLGDLGVIDPRALRRSADACLSHSWNDAVSGALFFTLQTELWLRARVGLDTESTHHDGHAVAVLPPGEWPGQLQNHGGERCISSRS